MADRRRGQADLTVSVNLSGRQIADAGSWAMSRAILATTGLDPACLTLEITESVLVRDVETTIARAARASRRSASVWRSTTSAPATRR